MAHRQRTVQGRRLHLGQRLSQLIRRTRAARQQLAHLLQYLCASVAKPSPGKMTCSSTSPVPLLVLRAFSRRRKKTTLEIGRCWTGVSSGKISSVQLLLTTLTVLSPIGHKASLNFSCKLALSSFLSIRSDLIMKHTTNWRRYLVFKLLRCTTSTSLLWSTETAS